MPLTFSKTTRAHLSDTLAGGSHRKSKGCGCVGCFFGCLLMILVLAGMAAGGFWYVYQMDKTEILGALAIKLLKNQSINLSLTSDINASTGLSATDKVAVKIVYDKFLSDYDAMPPEKQTQIKNDFGKLLKKFLTDPNLLLTQPLQPELQDLITLIAPEQMPAPEILPPPVADPTPVQPPKKPR